MNDTLSLPTAPLPIINVSPYISHSNKCFNGITFFAGTSMNIINQPSLKLLQCAMKSTEMQTLGAL